MTAGSIIYYWRPGCPFCSALERNLDQFDLSMDRRNIWDDPVHAAELRSIANGNETVPTLVIGDTELVNPTAHEVLVSVLSEARELLPADFEMPEPNLATRVMNRLLGG